MGVANRVYHGSSCILFQCYCGTVVSTVSWYTYILKKSLKTDPVKMPPSPRRDPVKVLLRPVSLLVGRSCVVVSQLQTNTENMKAGEGNLGAHSAFQFEARHIQWDVSQTATEGGPEWLLVNNTITTAWRAWCVHDWRWCLEKGGKRKSCNFSSDFISLSLLWVSDFVQSGSE